MKLKMLTEAQAIASTRAVLVYCREINCYYIAVFGGGVWWHFANISGHPLQAEPTEFYELPY